MYQRYQLAEDIHGSQAQLTPQQVEAINAIRRPQLQEDVHMSLTKQEVVQQREDDSFGL